MADSEDRGTTAAVVGDTNSQDLDTSTDNLEQGAEAPEASGEESKSQESSPKEYSDAELKAMESGWKPKEEFGGDTSKWVDAEEFNRRGELFDKIDVLSRDLKESKKALRMLQEHHQKVRESEYKRALTELKAEKKAAYESGDSDKLVEIDDRIAEVKVLQTREEQQLKQQANSPDPRFVQWVERNNWYAQDTELRAFADTTGTAHAASNPGKSPEEVLDYVSKKVRQAYPEKFTNPNRTKPSAVEGNAQIKDTSRKPAYQLSEEEVRVMNTFVRQGIMTKDEYIAQLKQVKGD